MLYAVLCTVEYCVLRSTTILQRGAYVRIEILYPWKGQNTKDLSDYDYLINLIKLFPL